MLQGEFLPFALILPGSPQNCCGFRLIYYLFLPMLKNSVRYFIWQPARSQCAPFYSSGLVSLERLHFITYPSIVQNVFSANWV